MLRKYRMKSFGQLLVALIVVTLLQPFLAQHRLVQILALLILLDGIYIAMPKDVGQRFRRAINLLWLLAAGLVVAARVSDQGIFRDSFDVAGGVFQTILFALCLTATLLHVLRERRVTLDLIYAAMAGYFFIVATFAGIYKIAFVVDSAAFQFQSWVTDVSKIDAWSQLSYFSFVTAASLGYGDILPRNPYVQMVAVIEVVIGQFYLATVIARLVSLYGKTPDPGTSDEA
ncbi:MAG: potassium channel family protein [Thermoanaerobaculia bacterium]